MNNKNLKRFIDEALEKGFIDIVDNKVQFNVPIIEERDLFKKVGISLAESNNNLFEVWHVVWKGEARRGVLTYMNESGFVTTRIVDETYKLNREAGDINIESDNTVDFDTDLPW